MEFMSELAASDLKKTTSKSDVSFDADTQKKFDALMEDDKISKSDIGENTTLSSYEIDDKYNSLFKQGDLFKTDVASKTESTSAIIDTSATSAEVADVSPTKAETDVAETDKIEKDDNGNDYMKNGELLPNNEYTINENNTYKTDDQSRITSFNSKPKYTTEGGRDLTEQKEIGGDERKSDDDGGHLVARVLGGSEGKENLVPMRRTINRGDYKKMENEIAAACKENKDVSLCGDVKYSGDSQRPSIIRTEYQIDDKKVVAQFDNKENSTELLDKLKGKISEQDYSNLCDEKEDMKADGCDVSITSVKTEYDANGTETKVTVAMLDERTSEKTYKVYYPNKEV